MRIPVQQSTLWQIANPEIVDPNGLRPSRSARLFSYHYMIRLVMDFACFYLHTAKGNLPQAFMMVCRGASYPTVPRYSQSLFAVDVYEYKRSLCILQALEHAAPRGTVYRCYVGLFIGTN